MNAIVFTKNNARITHDESLISQMEKWPNAALAYDYEYLFTAPPQYWVKTVSGKVRVMTTDEKLERDADILKNGVDNELRCIDDFKLYEDLPDPIKIEEPKQEIDEPVLLEPIVKIEETVKKSLFSKENLVWPAIAIIFIIELIILFMVKKHG